MSFNFDVTVAGPTANAYATRAQTNDMALSMMPAEKAAWAAITDDDSTRGPFIVRAARAIDRLPLLGRPSSNVQAMQFPRIGIFNPAGSSYASMYYDPGAWPIDAIPAPVITVNAMLAVWLGFQASLSSDDPFALSSSGELKTLKVGSIGLEFNQDATASPGDLYIGRVIWPMLSAAGLLDPSGVVRLTR